MNIEEIGIPPGTIQFIKDSEGNVRLARIFQGKEIPMTWGKYIEHCEQTNYCCQCHRHKLVYRPATEKDMASEKYKKAQEICEKEIKIEI